MWYALGIAAVLLLAVAWLLWSKRPLLALVDLASLDHLHEKSKKKAIVRVRGERWWQDFFKAGRERTFAVWARFKKAVRPAYYWALQQVEASVALQPLAPEKDERQLEEECIQKIFNDPQDIKSYVALAGIYAKDKKYDEVAEILAHVRRIARRYPQLAAQYFGDAISLNAALAALEKETSLS